MKRKNFLRILAIIMTILLNVCFVSCKNDVNKQEIEKLNAKIDSLEKANTTRQTDLNNLASFIEVLSDGLDSIAQQENVLFYTNKGKEKTIVDRAQLKKNLEVFQNTLANQRERIAQLTDSLKKKGANITKLNNLVNYLNLQLDEKDRMIKQMQADLNKKNLNISHLKDRIYTLAEDNQELTKDVDNQKRELSVKDDIMNEAYVLIATKKELKDGGFISGGFLKKQTVNYQNLSKEKFKKVDIRTFREITIPSKRIKILTQMPSSSYEIKKDGEKTIIKITDPISFWNITNYLIIQTN